MNFVDSLSLFHVDAKEIPCLTDKGAPTEKTEGAPGVLYMDTDTGVLYKCRAADLVNGVFAWEEAVQADSSQNGDGLTDTEKTLILSLFRNAAYTADMSATFAQLEALWSGSGEVPDEPEEPDVPVVTLTSISATYSGGDVPVGTAVTALTGIVVVASYSDGTSKAVTDYTLSGTIVEGSNTITVSYGGMTTTFTVTGVAEETEEEETTAAYVASNVAIYTAGATDVWTDGYINDSNEVVAMSDNYFYDEYLEAQGFSCLGSDNNRLTMTHRIVEYDADKNFLGRKYEAPTSPTLGPMYGDNSPVYIKCGMTTDSREKIHTIAPLSLMQDVCTVEGVTIDTSGVVVEYSGRKTSKYIPMEATNAPIVIHASSDDICIVAFYDSDYALVERNALVEGQCFAVFAVPDNTAYCRICVKSSNAVYTTLRFTAK